jgi:hypothetical protein
MSAAVYDSGSDGWPMLDPMPTAGTASGNVIDGKIYVFGG